MKQLELTQSGDGWVTSNLTIPFDINYLDFDANSQVFDPLSLNEATISWKCEGSICDENDILAQENITFPEINFDSGKKSIYIRPTEAILIPTF